jgi:hypothetical protein
VAKLVAGLLATAALWVRIQTSLKNTKMSNTSEGVRNALKPAKKNMQKLKKTRSYGTFCTGLSLKFFFLLFQDSLWNVKHPNGDPMGLAAQGYGGYYGEPTQHQYTMQQQQQQYTYEEYAHYPHPEEYMNERNRAYFHHNGEQYAMPTKQQQRHRLDSDCK